MMTESRGASNEKAKRELGWQPRYAELAARLRRGAGLTPVEAVEDLRPAGVRDRLPDARQRQRGRGRRPGGSPAPPPPLERGRADRVAARVPVHRRHAAARSTSCARPACGARPTSASGCRSRWWRARTRTRPGTPRPPTRSRSPSSSCSRASRRSSAPSFLLREVFDYPYERDRRRSSTRASRQRAPAGGAGAAARRRGPRRASTPRASSATSSPTASSPPRRRATSKALEALLAAGRRAARRRRRQGAGAGARDVSAAPRVAKTLRNWVEGRRARSAA